MEQPGREYTQTQIDQFEFRSEINDICSNVIDLTVFRKSRSTPMLNYLVAMEGNVQMTSSLAHIGNSIPDYFERPMFKLDGTKSRFPLDSVKMGAVKTSFPGSIKKGAFLRPDCKIGAVKIFQVTIF